MKIIIGEKNAELIKDCFLLLKLPDQIINNDRVDVYCAVERATIMNVPNLDELVRMHNFLLEELKNIPPKGDLVHSIVAQLYDQFNGELNSFYDYLINS